MSYSLAACLQPLGECGLISHSMSSFVKTRVAMTLGFQPGGRFLALLTGGMVAHTTLCATPCSRVGCDGFYGWRPVHGR